MGIHDETLEKLRRIQSEVEKLGTIRDDTVSSLQLSTALDALISHIEILRKAAQEHQELQVLREIDKVITRSLDLKEVAHLALGKTLEELDPTGQFDLAGTLQLLNESGDRLYDYAARGVAKENIPVKVGEGITGLVVARKESIRVPDVRSEEWKNVLIDVTGNTTRSELAVPLRNNGEILGVLNIESPRPGVFTPSHQEFLEIIAGQIMIAIERTRQHKRIENYSEGFKIIEKINTILSTTLDLHKLADAILSGVLEKLDRTRERQIVGTLQLVNKSGGVLEDYAGFGFQKNGKKLPVPIGQGITGLVAQTGKPCLIDDVRSEEWKNIFIDAMASWTRSELAVPLKSQYEVIGVLNVESPVVNAFDPDDQGFLEVLAGLTVVAIQNVRRFKRTQQRTIDLEKVSAQEMQAAAYAHRVNSKLGLVPVRVKSIRRLLDEAGLRNPKIGEHLSTIEDSTRFVTHLTGYFRKAAQISPEGLFNVNDLLEEAIQQAAPPSRISIVKNYDPALPEIKTNRVLVDLFVELISNSDKAMPRGGVIEISSQVENDEWILVTFKDSGYGIKPESLPRIFDMFFTDRPKIEGEEIVSTGFGLWWLKSAIVKLGGLVECESEVNKGTTFYIRLPLKE